MINDIQSIPMTKGKIISGGNTGKISYGEIIQEEEEEEEENESDIDIDV